MTLFALAAFSLMLLFMIAGIWSGRRSRSFCDYSVAGRECGSFGVSGVLLGSLVGGASTVGTVQMAYQWGMSAWWFTLGGGLGCLVLGLWFAVPLRRSNLETIPGFLSLSYGRSTATVAVIASAAGTFISIIAQFLSGAALLRGVFPAGGAVSVILVGGLVLSFIFMGGLKSFSAIGIGKILILYATLAACAVSAVRMAVSIGAAPVPLPFQPWFNPFGQGLGEGLSAGLSLVAGVLCTQIYIQAVFSASSPATARRGALLSALLMPPLGLLGITVGLAMRRSGIMVEPSTALSHFIASSFHPVFGGLLWGGILITVIGTAAGLTLGVATNLACDLIPSFPRLSKVCGDHMTWSTRVAVMILVLSAGIAGIAWKDSLILKWSYLSMGLRASGTFFPLAAAVLAPGRLKPGWAMLSGIAGLLTTILWPLAGSQVQPLFAGMAASAVMAGLGILSGKGRTPLPESR